ncbi:PDZ domain-containing protein [Flagellimonas pacifica]|uniref:PDZ domain-containing protein n=1 Tax=Flagellimonas pacifica TaxID=1247520 RepID=A0A285MCE5_9FLAO|nr:PDZ domain-containing protein [Allomuricauda parva]SNY94852.1 PDZ domain-containing protein [Allomuricauda parva]
MKLYVIWPFILLMVFFTGCQTKETHLYIGKNLNDPDKISFNSVQEGLTKAKQIYQSNKNSKVIMHLLEGNHYLDSSLKITSELNGLQILGPKNGVAVIKGSRKLSLNWEKYSDSIWMAKVSGNTMFDQLFVNGKKQILARYPNYNENGGHWQGHASDAIAPERIKTWSQPIGAIVHAMHAGEWGGFHYMISKIDENGEAVLQGGHQNNRKSAGIHDTYRMVENVFEELDAPREWFLNSETQILYYWPEEGVKPQNTIMEGVHLKHLITIKGDQETPVKDVLIKDLKFEHAQRTINEDYEPLLRSDWTIYRGGAVFIQDSENVTIKDCEFSNLGGNVLFVSNYNQQTHLIGNHIHDCGASGISFVGNPSAVRSPAFQYREFVPFNELDTVKGPANNSYPKEGLVDNNLIYRTGRLEKQTAGVQISMAMNITVSNNSIYDVPRAGINISEGTWGGHLISYNDVFNTVLESGDHGSFNSWGRDRFWHPNRAIMDKMVLENPEMPLWDAIHTTVIKNNRFRCDHGWDIDLDDGSSNYKIYNNLCLNGGLKLREGFYRTVENNIMINNGFHPHVWFKNSGDVFRKNIVLTDHKDIRLQSWGKEVDYNLFPDEEALIDAQKNNVDTNSFFGNPKFMNPEKGNYTIAEDSPALTLGFKNFSMDSFGVKKPSLRKLAKTPEFPVLWSISGTKKTKGTSLVWLGGHLKNIETLAERSASGLNKTSGILITEIDTQSVLALSQLESGDVIVGGEGAEINTIKDLMKLYQEHGWKGHLSLQVYRNQKKNDFRVKLKK